MNIRIQCICNCKSNTFLYASLVALAWLLNSLNLVWLGWGILIGRERFFQSNTRVLYFIMEVVRDKEFTVFASE